MSGGEGLLCLQQLGERISCRVVGHATMRQSPALRCRIEQALVSGPITLHVDLHECVYMDSTFLGMLIMFRRMLVNRHLGQFALVAPSPECSRLLRQMGLDATFCILAEESPPDVPEELLESETDAPYSQRNIVECTRNWPLCRARRARSFAMWRRICNTIGKAGRTSRPLLEADN